MRNTTIKENQMDLFKIDEKAPEFLFDSECVDGDLDKWAYCHKDGHGVWWTVWVSDEQTVLHVERTSKLHLAYYGVKA
jgi:hypothetical protein